jgi:hypothetical protein
MSQDKHRFAKKRARQSSSSLTPGLVTQTRIKHQKLDVCGKGRLVSRTYTLSEHLMCNTVLALLRDLQLGDNVSQVINNHTSALVENLCEYFTTLNITEMRFTRNKYNITITAVSNSREIVLASLTSSKLMSSMADLAVHLFYMLRSTFCVREPFY